jgi:hypothetical protein
MCLDNFKTSRRKAFFIICTLDPNDNPQRHLATTHSLCYIYVTWVNNE